MQKSRDKETTAFILKLMRLECPQNNLTNTSKGYD